MTHDEKELDPADALDICNNAVIGTIRSGPGGKPGELIARMPQRIRKALEKLTADDIQDVRVESFLGPIEKK